MSFFDLGNNENNENNKDNENLPDGELERRNQLEKENQIKEQQQNEQEEKEKKDEREQRPENKPKKFQFLIPEEKYNKMKDTVKNTIKGFMNKLDQKKQELLGKNMLSLEKKAKEATTETDRDNITDENGVISKPWYKFWGGKRHRTRRKRKGKKKRTRKMKKRRTRKMKKRKGKKRRKTKRKKHT